MFGIGKFFRKDDEQEQQREMDEAINKWPLHRTTNTITKDEKKAQKVASAIWETGKKQLENVNMWNLEKHVDNVKVYTAECTEMKKKICKVEVELQMEWKTVYDMLMRPDENPKWNTALESCEIVATLPSKPDESAFKYFIIYMRLSDATSKLITKRDFCTTYKHQKTKDMGLWVGTSCKVAICPEFGLYVRGEQSIVVIACKEVTATSCLVTQIGSMDFKGNVMQSLVDSNMPKTFVSYGQCLNKHVKTLKPARNDTDPNP